MEESENKICDNCKRDIPRANFTTHVVHCARNIRICPACKEPVLLQDLQAHHDAMHKLVPCEQCGESVCGADMEDHVRDSCAHTMQTCRYCSLELPRASLPAHGRYCGARTERCCCGEWVMLRYKQLHLDSNHGFIRLDDDPVPIQSLKTETKTATTKATGISNGLLNNISRPKYVKNGASEARNVDNERNIAGPSGSGYANNIKSENTFNVNGASNPVAGTSQDKSNPKSESNLEENLTNVNGAIPRQKKSNGQQAIKAENTDRTKKTSRSSRGTLKKRPAPPPPPLTPPTASSSAAAPANPMLAKAMQRQREETERRMNQNQENMAKGLPPILTPAEKIERLRKMDALHNREIDDQSWKNRLQGRVWSRPEVYPVGSVLGSRNTEVNGEVRKKLRNLKPMTPEEFHNRYKKIQTEERPDRFSEIKTSLRELRRGLNEVTAPYNSNSNNDTNHNRRDEEAPCEFCGTIVLLEDLVLHQTGCRPDLTQYRRPSPSRSEAPLSSSNSPPPPLIPCEFCAMQLPVHLVSHHQERCGRERNILFPD